MFHTATCETDEEIIKIKQCNPKTMTECEDVEVPSQKLEYVVRCQNVTTTYCTNDLTTLRADEGEDVAALAPIIPLLAHTCVETLHRSTAIRNQRSWISRHLLRDAL